VATLVTQYISRLSTGGTSVGGTTIIPVAATGTGDAMQCGPDMMLYVVNAGAAASSTVTMNIPTTRVWETGVALTSPAISVQAGQTKLIGAIDAPTFADPTTGLCSISYSQGTISVAAVQLTR